LAIEAAHLADQKKATDIRVVEVTEQFGIADFFVMVTANSRPQAKAIYNEIHMSLKERGMQHRPVEGAELGWWVLLDYGAVVVHIMQTEAREYYELDRLYADSPEVDWQSARTDSSAETA
jgi:ribosome-associated protein